MKPAVLGQGLASVPKLRRYFEARTDHEGRLIIDDRADLPETIDTVFDTIKQRYPEKKIWCLYQPGSYLRTKARLTELKQVLQRADFLYLADIKGYPKEKSEGLNIRQLVSDLKRDHSQTYYFDSAMDMTVLLDHRVTSNDCILTLGIEGICQTVTEPLLVPKTE